MSGESYAGRDTRNKDNKRYRLTRKGREALSIAEKLQDLEEAEE